MVIRPSGGSSEADPPVPIPNTEVKRFSADDTALVTVWENRSLPGGFFLFPCTLGNTSHPARFSFTFPVQIHPQMRMPDVRERVKTPPYRWFASNFPCATMNLAYRRKESWLLRVPGEVTRPPRHDAVSPPESSLNDNDCFHNLRNNRQVSRNRSAT